MPIDVVLAESGNVGEALTAIAKIKKATHLVLGGGKKSGLKGLGIGMCHDMFCRHESFIIECLASSVGRALDS